MPIINTKEREISCKIVYYGPSLGGKTTNIQQIHAKSPADQRSQLQCVNTQGDRTLFFDHFDLNLGSVGGMKTRFQIYGVPGQVRYRVTRKMVLSGVDGVVFVADSSGSRLGHNIESLEDLRWLLSEYDYDFASIPLVFQYNKRDLPDARPVEELARMLDQCCRQAFEAVAIEGVGVTETFKAVCAEVVAKLNGSMEHVPDRQ